MLCKTTSPLNAVLTLIGLLTKRKKSLFWTNMKKFVKYLPKKALLSPGMRYESLRKPLIIVALLSQQLSGKWPLAFPFKPSLTPNNLQAWTQVKTFHHCNHDFLTLSPKHSSITEMTSSLPRFLALGHIYRWLSRLSMRSWPFLQLYWSRYYNLFKWYALSYPPGQRLGFSRFPLGVLVSLLAVGWGFKSGASILSSVAIVTFVM